MRARRHLPALLFCTAVLFVGASAAKAQETPQETAQLDRVTIWKCVNTLIFAVGLGFLIYRYAPAFFNARSREIQKAIEEATGLKMDADFRSSEMDRKMASLPEEIKKLRTEFETEMEREHEHYRSETDAAMEHIHRNVIAEINAFREEGIRQIRQHTVELALGLAEQKIAERVARDGNLGEFIHLVEQGRN